MMPALPHPTVTIFGRLNVSARANLLRLVAGVLLLTFTALPGFSMASAPARRTSDASNLRQIGQASLIYAQVNSDQLPRATDVWNYAELIAKDGGLESPSLWLSREDVYYTPPTSNMVRLPSGALDPDFRKLPLAFAIPVYANLSTNAPSTTPIAWTRGLQPDGTWSKDSPYKGDGGHIVFIGGNVQFFKNLKGDGHTAELTRFDGKGTTANILEALPPGAHISEYVPTAAERRAKAEKEYWRKALPFLIAAVIWLNLVTIGVCLWIKKILKPAVILITLIISTVLTIAVANSVL